MMRGSNFAPMTRPRRDAYIRSEPAMRRQHLPVGLGILGAGQRQETMARSHSSLDRYSFASMPVRRLTQLAHLSEF
jgi:hypothetical protein